jgi:hypothetical protein
MNTRIAIAFAALASLLGCSTPHTAQTTQPQPTTPPPSLSDLAPRYKFHEGQLVPQVLIPPQICKLGTSCLAMDPRPFEPCLLSTKHCSDKAVEPLLVAPAPSIIPAPQEVSR